MRCSSSETLLDEYVDGTLSPRNIALVAKHVANCASCARLLAEVRVIDALLLGPRQIELAANFTHKAMAEIRSMPAPHAHRARPFAILLTYLAFAWIAIGSFYFFGGATARAAYGVALGSLNGYIDSATALGGAASHLLGPHAGVITGVASVIFIGDVIFASIVAGAYAFNRSRIAARNAREAC